MFQDFTILIYDNSDDSTPKICQEYLNHENRIIDICEKIRPAAYKNGILLLKK